MKMSKHYWIVAYTQTGYNNDDHNVLIRLDFDHSLLVISSHKYNKSNLITSTMNIYDWQFDFTKHLNMKRAFSKHEL